MYRPATVERCLACEADSGRQPWSVASLARPTAVGNRGAVDVSHKIAGSEGALL